MNIHDAQAQWKELLPPSFTWVDKLELAKTASYCRGAHHLVMVKGSERGEGEFIIDAPLLGRDLEQKITEAAKAAGYTTGSTPFTVVCDGSPFSLIPQNTFGETPQQRARQAGLDGAAYLRERKITELVLCAGRELSALGIWEGLAQGCYVLDGFKGEKAKAGLLPAKISLWDKQVSADEVTAAKASAQAICLARLLGDAPPNWLNPPKLAEIAAGMAAEVGISCQVKGRKELTELKMGSFLSVAQGSAVEPQLITLTIKGKNPKKKVALIGKGLTFDAGGLCLKPAGGMGEMKYDMCGGAAVMATAFYLAKVQPPVDVICVIGAAENLIGEKATRPGDIVKAMNGKTIEVLNTDAEGRLVLADCLHYANETWKPDLMVDIATLTGAVLMALGSCGAALVANDQQAASYALNTAKKAGEPLWQLPLWPELAKELKSDVADLKNIPNASVKAGTLTASCFLREFVGDRKWIHLDIAGTGWNCKAVGYPGAGGSGFGVKTLAQICMDFDSAGLSS